MNITILMGSPNRNGSTHILVDELKKGAEDAGHTCDVIDVCHADIHPCIGCVACGYEGQCVQKDDVEIIKARLLSSDMVVFATPLYYYGMSAQLKAVVDRFCAYNSSLNSRHLKSALAYKGILCSATEVKCSRQFYTVSGMARSPKENIVRSVFFRPSLTRFCWYL